MKKAYPRQLHPYQTLDGRSRVVKDAIEEELYTGVKMNPDGSVFVEGAGSDVELPPIEPTPEELAKPAPEATPELDHEAAADALGI